MKKTLAIIAGASLLIFSSCTRDEDVLSPITEENVVLVEQESDEFLTIEEINTIIDKSLNEKGAFSWDDVPANVLWSAAVHGREMITVGYGNKGESFREGKSSRLEGIQNDILLTVAASESQTKSNLKYVSDAVLNVIDIHVTGLETIRDLKAMSNIRYLEPNGYSYFTSTPEVTVSTQQRSSSGCDMSGSNLNTNDYRTIAPGSLVSWTLDNHNVTQAWNESTGAGVTLAVIDTGISPNQPLLSPGSSGFGDGYSINNRTVEKYGTYIDSPWWWSNNIDGPNDRCGHGTSMISAATAPRNNDNKPVGVAYDANLVSYRGTADVLLNDYHERKGVSNALRALGDRSDVKIISMSIGYLWTIRNVRDAVRYAHNRGKLIFAAGGTSTEITNAYPVIFPASMPETIAVTGVTDANNYKRCDTCHSGPQIEFTIVMERDNDNSRTAAVLGFYGGDNDYVGGSSVATATTAGIAALVWAKYPNWSRTQVLNRMRQSSELYPNRSNAFGYGNIDANQAVQ
ncbi:S8 family serine peptidase [uncultured Dokdonia sp.]|uniref:S8 family peptidase n=1 Tax=uncultured Dokdonia sp. TaxID=575653 RepID=UPI00263979B8|nr:S8 family serine peptidase [uncultured Dokdonia sp.]